LSQFSKYCKGTTRQILTRDDFKNVKIILPPIEDQPHISSILEKELTRVENLKANYIRFVEILQEKRLALITHAVTRGLDPKARMKDSGVEWIGEIPEHWRVKPLKYTCVINPEQLAETTDPNYEIKYIDISCVNRIGEFLGSEDMIFETAPSRARRKVRRGDTIISTVRTYLKAIANISDCADNMIVSTGFAVLRPFKIWVPKYLYYMVTSEPFVQKIVANSVGVAYPAINPLEAGRFKVLIPGIDEQNEIVEYIESQTQKMDMLIKGIKKQIDLLNEYKTSLISHAVTGKIDLRGVA
jgi:type I restriction enzyme S subunit